MRATYEQKLELVRTGLSVMAATQQKMQQELSKFLQYGDTLWVRIGDSVLQAEMVSFADAGHLRVDVLPKRLAAVVRFDQLVEEPRP